MGLLSNGLVVPARLVTQSPDTIAAFVTLDDYAEEPLRSAPISLLKQTVTRGSHSRDQLLLALSVLNRAASVERPGFTDLARQYTSIIGPPFNPAVLEATLRDPGLPRVFVARHPILLAMRDVIVHGKDDDDPDARRGRMFDAIFLSHILAAELEEIVRSRVHPLPDDEYLFMDRLCSAALRDADDLFSTLGRYFTLWLEYGLNVTSVGLRDSPSALLREATGLELVEIMALATCIAPRADRWASEPPSRDISLAEFSPHQVEVFLRLVADDLAGLQNRLAGQTGPYHLSPFQETPALRRNGSVLVLDEQFLWERVTSGLYWIVHDHEKNQVGEHARGTWSQAYGEMIERLAEDHIVALAPAALDGQTFFTEHDLARAYGGKTPDAAIDYGYCFALFEIVSGRVKLATRLDADAGSFQEDSERLVIEKCQQLDAAARALLDDDSALTHRNRSSDLRIMPILVAGGSFPLTPDVSLTLTASLSARGLLHDPRINPLGVITLRELEMLEALAEQGTSVPKVLEEWKASAFRDHPLRNFLLAQVDTSVSFRAARVEARGKAVFEAITNAAWG